MDVDLLRPGTVPISPDTILWFEFLLSEDLLLKHLQRQCPDPSPTDLINKFTTVVFESSANDVKRIELDNGDSKESTYEDSPKYSLKHLALKILSLKVASYIKWNFDLLKVLPFRFQLNVLQDLMYFTNNETVAEIPNVPEYNNPSALSEPFLFALILYHRWVVKIAVNYVFGGMLKIFSNVDVSSLEETIIRTPENIQRSIYFLTEALSWEHIPSLLTFNCFTMLTEKNTDIQNDWSHSVPISKDEFCAQITYDLAVFYFFKENYEAATSYFTRCIKHYRNCEIKTGFLILKWDELEGYLLACNTPIDTTKGLLQQLHTSVVNQYMGILNILQQDNISRKIPVSYRINLELDIHGALSSGKFTVARDLLPKIQALNAVRCILAKVSTYHYDITSSTVDIFIWAISPLLKQCTEEDKQHVQSFLIESILRQNMLEVLNKLVLNDIITKGIAEKMSSILDKKIALPNVLLGPQKEILEYTNRYALRNIAATTARELRAFIDNGLPIKILPKRKYRLNERRIQSATVIFERDGLVGPFLKMVSYCVNSLLQNNLADTEAAEDEDYLLGPLDGDLPPQFAEVDNQRLEVRSLEQQIISCYDSQELRLLLVKITSKSPSRSVWRINPCWELPIPLQSVLVAMPKGFLQDFSFIILAKSRELMLSKNWKLSLELLKILELEVRSGAGNFIPKLSRLINWEVLLIKINQLLEEWPAPDIDKNELAEECEACLQTGESVLPRTEIMEHCALCLLSLGHWEFLTALEKRWNYFEIAATIASACQDLVKYKANKKLSRDLWDLALPVFGSSPLQSKRSSSGNTSVVHRDSPIANSKMQLVSFFLRFRDTTVLTIIISMLARLHNVLRDESSLELSIDYIMLWPAVVSNANSYNSKAVLEVLMEILTKALYYYPSNVPWMRLMGDINFVNGHNEKSLNYYLKSLLIASDNFNLPIRNDDHVIRRMIKNCSALNCYTQAAVLCQFLEEPDYTVAFHSLAEQKLCSDATDAYYHCFWDTSILEYLVNLHHKRAEFQRRKHAVQVMGLLELNSNNNEEIQHEASNLRKNIFLRALCRQYIQ